MAVKCVLSRPASIIGSLLGCFSSIRKFAGEIVTFAPLIVRALFEKLKEYLASEILATDRMSRLNMTTQSCIVMDNRKHGAIFSVNT
jgi:hypothetical protein